MKEPGVKLAPAGITARELIDEFCGGMADGHTFKAYLPGGASGGILPASMADIPLDFGKLEQHGCFVGSHAVVVLSDQDDMKAVALNLLRFFEDESCGQCTPCRVGCEKAVKLMQRECLGRGAARGAVPGDGGCLDLRPRPGGAEPDPLGHEVLPGRDRHRPHRQADPRRQGRAAGESTTMALMLGQLYDALRAGNVPDDKARAAAEEVANYEGELTKLRVDIDRAFRKWANGSVEWKPMCGSSNG